MQYRSFGKTTYCPSALGFGCMRLPVVGDDPANIDYPSAERMIHYAISNGVNYLDTAWGYHRRMSEVFLGKALQGGWRDKVAIATKMPMWLVESRDDCERLFEEQLERLKTDRVEFYLLHNLNREYWPKVHKYDVFEWAQRELTRGRIQHFGFSFHDGFDCFKQIVDEYPWEFCQIQYNYVDIDNQAGRKGLHYAASKGLAVVVMEPLLGGALAKPASPEIERIFGGADQHRSAVEWALGWLWDQPEVSLVLSGMSSMQQVKENVEYAGRSGIGRFTEEERDTVRRVSEEYRNLIAVPCTMCGYCMPCEHGVDIPKVFALYNDALGFSRDEAQIERARQFYVQHLDQTRATDCIECGACESKCPQQIAISRVLKEAHQELSHNCER